jgi:hypothetical protein
MAMTVDLESRYNLDWVCSLTLSISYLEYDEIADEA